LFFQFLFSIVRRLGEIGWGELTDRWLIIPFENLNSTMQTSIHKEARNSGKNSQSLVSCSQTSCPTDVLPRYLLLFYFNFVKNLLLSKSAQAVTLLPCIQELAGSNLGRDTDYHNEGFSSYSLVPPGNCRDNNSSETTTASFHIPSNSFPYHPTIQPYIGSPSYWRR
jgi:hypothetical protein